MLGSLNHYFMGPQSVHLIINSVSLPVQLPFDEEGGEFIGNDSQCPARSVRRGSVFPECKDFRRGLVLISLTEGQNPPIVLDCSVTKSEGLLPLSIEMITHLPWIGSFLSSGMMDFPKERMQEFKKGNYF